MKSLVLDSIRISDYGLNSEDISLLNDSTVIVTKWDWEYGIAHKFQRAALELVQNTPNLRILICCNHPEVLTNGRGLQKPRKGEVLELVEFDPSQHKNLPYPLFQIERGGGLTFHHPGQFIFYPIVKLNPKYLSLSLMIDQIFDFSIEVLNSWGISDLDHANKLLGLWQGNRKLASMGIAIEKLTTFHGMALNILPNKNMKGALSQLNPCGLNAETYISAGELMNLPALPIESFKKSFLEKVQANWK
jgi:lipoyl(octanoyl) transferase